MNKKMKKLTLNRETLRNLEDKALLRVAGGESEVDSECRTACETCTCPLQTHFCTRINC